jgi:hypothetical protein
LIIIPNKKDLDTTNGIKEKVEKYGLKGLSAHYVTL